MSQCLICRVGELQDERVETWMKRANQWVLFTGVPARKCDNCGETTFTQQVAERLADILAASSSIPPTGSRWYPEYDLDTLDATGAAGMPSRAGAHTPG